MKLFHIWPLSDEYILNFLLKDRLPYGDVKDVASHRAGDGHVAQTFTSHNHAGDEVWDGGSCCEDGQAHDLLRNADRLAYLWAGADEEKTRSSMGEIQGKNH